MNTRIILIMVLVAILAVFLSSCNIGGVVNGVANQLDNPNPNLYDYTDDNQKINHDLCVAQGDQWCK